MAAYTFHRKILEETPSNSPTSSITCSSDCDSLKNPTLDCLPTCVFNYSSPPPPPPSPPSSSDGGYILTTPPKHHHSSLSLPLKISLVILVLTFSFFILYTFYKFYTVWYRSRRRRLPPPSSPEGDHEHDHFHGHEQTHDEFVDQDVVDHPIWYIRTVGLQPSVISAITVVKYNKHDGLIEGASCSVCLSDFQEDETLRLLPKCNHAFHVSCIDTWLRSHTNCPLCRAGIVKSVTNSSSGNDSDETVTVFVTEENNHNNNEDEDHEDVDDDEQRSDLRIGVVVDDDDEHKVEVVGGSGIIRRSVSLNDYEAFRVRSDVCNDINNNYFYSDRHEVQIRSVDGSLGFELVKIDRTGNNQEP